MVHVLRLPVPGNLHNMPGYIPKKNISPFSTQNEIPFISRDQRFPNTIISLLLYSFFLFSLVYLSLFPLSISLNKFSVIFTPVGIRLCGVCSSCKPSKRLHRDMSVFQQNMMKILSFDFSRKKAKI